MNSLARQRYLMTCPSMKRLPRPHASKRLINRAERSGARAVAARTADTPLEADTAAATMVRPSSSAVDDASKSQVHVRSAVKFLREELPRMFKTGEVTRARFDPNIQFVDPITRYNDLDGYCFNIRALATLFDVTFDLFDVSQAGQHSVRARWHLEMRLRVVPFLPWTPTASFTGVTECDVDPDTGLITKHVDVWDAVDNNEYLSLEALRYVIASLSEVKLTPALETPAYTVLFKAKNYEIRAYAPYLVAETPMSEGGGPASGSGFMELAGYIFGGNDARLNMEMTTPVFSKPEGPSSDAAMQFVLSRRFDIADLPAPTGENASRITPRSEGASVQAVRTFSGFPLDHEVVEAEQSLRAALQQDGLQPCAGYTLARYNEPTTLPFLRRNEVLIELAGYELPKAVH